MYSFVHVKYLPRPKEVRTGPQTRILKMLPSTNEAVDDPVVWWMPEPSNVQGHGAQDTEAEG